MCALRLTAGLYLEANLQPVSVALHTFCNCQQRLTPP